MSCAFFNSVSYNLNSVCIQLLLDFSIATIEILARYRMLCNF